MCLASIPCFWVGFLWNTLWNLRDTAARQMFLKRSPCCRISCLLYASPPCPSFFLPFEHAPHSWWPELDHTYQGSYMPSIKIFYLFFKFLKMFFIYFWDRERQRERERERRRVREGDTESETSSRLWAVSTEPDAGLEPVNHEIMSWAQVGLLTDRDAQAPPTYYIFTLCQSFTLVLYLHLIFKIILQSYY